MEVDRESRSISITPNFQPQEVINNNSTVDNFQQVEQSDQQAKASCLHRFTGILFTISSSVFFTLLVTLAKSMTNYHPFVLSFWRFQGALYPTFLIVSYDWMVKSKPVFSTIYPSTSENRKSLLLLFVAHFAGTCSTIFGFSSMKFVSAADTAVISGITPIFVSLVAHWLLREKTGYVPMLCGLMALIGVAVIARPPLLTGKEGFNNDTLIGTGLAAIRVIFSTCFLVLCRRLLHVHYGVMVILFGAWGSVQSLLLAILTNSFKMPESGHDWMMAFGIAILTFFTQICYMLATKFEQAGTISICKKCGDVVLVFVWEYIFIGTIPDEFSILGGSVVIIGVVLIAMRKFIQDLPENHSTRQRLKLLLK